MKKFLVFKKIFLFAFAGIYWRFREKKGFENEKTGPKS